MAGFGHPNYGSAAPGEVTRDGSRKRMISFSSHLFGISPTVISTRGAPQENTVPVLACEDGGILPRPPCPIPPTPPPTAARDAGRPLTRDLRVQ